VTRAGLALAVVAALVHLALGFSLHDTVLLPGDRLAFDVMGDLRFRAGVDVVRVLTDLGSLPVVAIVVALTAVSAVRRRGRVDQAIALVGGFVIVVALVHMTKDFWDRPRPTGRLQNVVGKSYPSGHAAYAATYVACAFVVGGRRLLAAAVGVTMAIGLSRLYLHVHFLTDVVGGYALTIAVFALLLRP
jgi:membrane-associated phospholipid phosphatase